MNRRNFVAGLSALGVLPGAPTARAQAPRRLPFRIVMYPDMILPFRRMLADSFREIGWSEGVEFVVVESGVSQDSPDLAHRAKGVVEQKPDLILTFSSNHTLALHRATKTIPIVMWTSGYPVEVGVANSLARPGKNVTGNTQYAGTGLWGKLLQLLKEVKPDLKRVGVYWGYVPPAFPKEEIEPCYREIREAAHVLGIAVNIVEVSTPGQVPAALASIDAGKPEALLLATSPSVWESRMQVMEFAIRRRLPTVADFVWPATDMLYPMLTFSPPTADLIRRSVAYIVRIRDGAKPGDLPIQLPARFELIVSRKTAQAIGMVLPQATLLRADRVIE